MNIRYHIVARPIVLYACHCKDCQKQSSSGFGLSLWVRRQDFILTRSQPGFWSTTADSGNSKLCALCDQCGCRIYHTDDHEADILSVKGGTLDNIEQFSPVGHIWLRSALPWVMSLIDRDRGNMLCYETEPPSFDELIQRWN